MAIIKAYVCCHAPILVHEVGQGEEELVKDTLSSYQQIAKEIAQLKPDTIVISSPHMHCYSDCFILALANKGYGSFSRFKASQVKFAEVYDDELNQLILDKAMKRDVPCYGDSNQGKDFTFDHGSLVPLYFIEKEYQDFKVVRISISGLSYAKHYEMGLAIQDAIEELGRKVVYIASGDLSHCQKEDGPYGFKDIGPVYDEKIMKTLAKGDFVDLLSYDPEMVDEAEVCGHPSFVMMAGALDGRSLDIHYYSHEATFGVGYGMVSFTPTGVSTDRNSLDQYYQKEKDVIQNKMKAQDDYVKLARDTIELYIKTGKLLMPDQNLDPTLFRNEAGVFVSIHEFGQLRGCIGTIAPTRHNIAMEIVNNAISACSNDPRFQEIREEELPYLDISVDVLSPFERVPDMSYLDPKKYGVIVQKGQKRGLLLPDLKGVDGVEQQVSIAKRKAGINAYEDEFELYRFTVVRHV